MATRTRSGRILPAKIFHALSDETRLQIVHRLQGGERCVCDLTDAMDAAQSRLSFHLKVLKEAGLITDRREGRWMYYTLDRETFARCAELIDHLAGRATAATRCDACC